MSLNVDVNRFPWFHMGNVEYVTNGEVVSEEHAGCVMVSAEGDLANLPDIYGAGSIAYLAGYSKMWQKSAAGTWVEIGA